MVPRTYSTPLISFFQSGLPNQIAKRSTFRPRQRAARKWPSSWTKISRLKSASTSRIIKMTFRMYILIDRQAATGPFGKYTGKLTAGNGGKTALCENLRVLCVKIPRLQRKGHKGLRRGFE